MPGIGTDVFARGAWHPWFPNPSVSPSWWKTGRGAERRHRCGVAKAAPDGYTVLFSSAAQTVALTHTVKNLPYDPQAFSPIMLALEPLIVMFMRAAIPANSFSELFEYAKRNPGKLSYGSTGTGSTFHLFEEAINATAGIQLLHVPYKGTLPAVNDILGGNLELSFGSLAGIGQLMAAGKLRAVAVMADKRASVLPDLPTVSEVVPGVEILPGWFAFWGPPGMPQPIARRLNAEILKAMNTPESRTWFEINGFVRIASSPEELSAAQRRGMETYGRRVKAMGIKPE